MGCVGRLGAIGLVLALGLDPTSVLEAGDRPAAEASAAVRLSTLRARLTEWYEARKNLVPTPCPRCAGLGRLAAGRGASVVCPRCEGRKFVLSVTAFRKVSYDMRSEAFRKRPNAQEQANAAYKAADGATRPPLYLKSFRVDRVELVGDRFGLGLVFEGTDNVSRESRWVRGVDPATKKDTWFVHEPETDGAFAAETVPADAAVPTRAPLTPERLEDLRKRLAVAGVRHDLEDAAVEGGVLHLRLFSKAPRSEEDLDRLVAADTVPAARTALAAEAPATAVSLVFLSRWRDKFGAVGRAPYVGAGIRRADFEKIVFENLTPGEVLQLFEPKRLADPEEGVRWWKD